MATFFPSIASTTLSSAEAKIFTRKKSNSSLSKHPSIADVAVCGVRDEKWGQVVKALIVRSDPKLTAQEVDRYCLESRELPRYRRPRIVEFVDALPRNVLGKIDRAALR